MRTRTKDPLAKPTGKIYSSAQFRAREEAARLGVPVPEWAKIVRRQTHKDPLGKGRNTYTASLVYTDLALWEGKQERECFRLKALKNARHLGESALVWHIEQLDFDRAIQLSIRIAKEINPLWGRQQDSRKSVINPKNHKRTQEEIREYKRLWYAKKKREWEHAKQSVGLTCTNTTSTQKKS